jgi:hypothetical protein
MLKKRGLRIVGVLSGFGATRERQSYCPVPRNALPTRYPSRERLSDAHVEVAGKRMNDRAALAMKAWRAQLSTEERAQIDLLPDPERMFD